MGHVHTRVYRDGQLEAEDFPLADVSDHLEKPDTVVWVDFCGPTQEDLHQLAEELSLHELAVEDAVEPHQRPKVDRYDTHLFLSCHAVRVDVERGALEKAEIGAFVSQRWLVTVRKDEGFPLEPVLKRWDRSTSLCANGVSFLLYGLLDVVVDGYFDAVEVFDDFYDEISELIFSEQTLVPAQQQHWFEMRRALVQFHRLAVPMREAVSSLMRRDDSAVTQAMYPYFQDVYDHILRVSESTDALRDLVSAIVETNVSLRDFRQNAIMKKVTSWAAIIAVPTLITGFYGMNVPYPGFARHSGVWLSVVLMVILSTTLYLSFKRRDWL
jgi:magnesium transporter